MATDSDLAVEQERLVVVRGHLARMREHALTLDISGTDPIAAERLAQTLWARARSMEDDGTSTLYFGRIDVDATHPATDGAAAWWYVGRRHIGDEAGDPLVIDWRAPVSTAFYRASRTDPMHVTLRRRFGVHGGQITAIEDEHLQRHADDDVETEESEQSGILAAEIERPRVGPMRDIVATIQPEQDELVRVDLGDTVCIQGAPGTGKTAVGLHRAAWLLYTFRQRLARSGVLIVGPNRAFLDHIGAVLPMLGELDVRHTTAHDLVAENVRVRGTDATEVAVLKGDARLAEVLHRAVWSSLVRPTEALEVPKGTRIWRVPAYDIAEVMDELTARGLPYDAARDLLPQRLAHLVLVRMETAGIFVDDERAQERLAKNATIKAYCKTTWPAVKAATVLHRLFTDADFLHACAEGILTDDEQSALQWARAPKTAGAAKWSAADAVLLDEMAWNISRDDSYGHVILDEAQDLSPMQVRAVGRRCGSTGSATILGDIAQGTTPWATPSWADTLTHLGRADGGVVELTRGFRVPGVILAYATRLLPSIAPDLSAPEPVRTAAGTLDVVAADDVVAELAARWSELAATPGTVGVIVPDADTATYTDALRAVINEPVTILGGGEHDTAPSRLQVVPATLAKGLEFDSVVVADPAGVVAAEPDRRTGLRRLYVVITRAVTHLLVLHRHDLPSELGA